MLGEFIEMMYPGLKFDIHIRNRDPKERRPDWYGHTYMELIVFDMIASPVYNPNTFEPSYRTPHCQEYISGERLYYDINSYIPDINKHLLISFFRCNDFSMNLTDIPSFECWRQYFMSDSRRREMSRGYDYF
jgi:hypothetical protein